MTRRMEGGVAARRATINDIAQVAGFTKGTVSLALNNDPRITPATRDKVRRAAEALHYVPHESARRLATGRADAIAVLAPRVGSQFAAQIGEAMATRAWECQRYQYGLHPFSTRNNPAIMRDLMARMALGRRADAVVAITQVPDEPMLEACAGHALPVVLVEGRSPLAHCVRLDNRAAAVLAVRHLADRGRGRLALVTGPQKAAPGRDANPAAVERAQGFHECVAALGLEHRPEWRHELLTYTVQDGRDAFKALRAAGGGFDAVFCAAGDMVALGLITEAREQGLDVPGDLAVVGFDDNLVAGLASPSLTTIRQPLVQMGQAAFDLALDAIDGRVTQRQELVLPPELVVRQSA